MKNFILGFCSSLCFFYSTATTILNPTTSQFGFIENKGQIIDQYKNFNKNVLYLYNGNGFNVQLKKSGFSYESIEIESSPKIQKVSVLNIFTKNEQKSVDYSINIHRIDISFVGSNTNTKITPSEPSRDFINYYTTSTTENGIINVHHFKKIVYENIYPFIDVEFILDDFKTGGGFKYNFIIHPGGNVNNIQLKIDGANKTTLKDNQYLVIETAFGNIEETIPNSYLLTTSDKQESIEASFIKLSTDNLLHSDIYGISVGKYDLSKTLIIDPAPWATYYGGPSDDIGYGIATDLTGNIFITGSTLSSSGIASSGAFQTTFGGGSGNDIFVIKVNSSGVRQWSTYYGNSGDDYGRGIVIDSSGNILISGYTDSNTGIATTGAYQTTMAGGGSGDAFIAKFNTSGARIWGTYYGGNAIEYNYSIATDKNSNIYITGETSSSSGISTSGSFQSSIGSLSAMDAFIAKFNSSGTIQWATYYGGNNYDGGLGVATDTAGNVFISGGTGSLTGIASSGAFQTTNSGNGDGFVVKFNSSGSRQWGTYYGGSNNDGFGKIVTDISGNLWITGTTLSSSGIATTASFQPLIGDTVSGDAMLIKLNSSGSRIYATYYGGTNSDGANGISMDSYGNIFISGSTTSIANIASTGVYQTNLAGTIDAFVAKFSSTGSRLWGTYFGGSNTEYGFAITNDAIGNTYLTGVTRSSTGIATSGAFQTIYGGSSSSSYGDAFIAGFNSNGGLPVKLITFEISPIKFEQNLNLICNWTTAFEINNNYFTVERGNDGVKFDGIGTVKGGGNSNKNISYTFKDETPNLGTSFYRLKQTDFDGKMSFSEIRKIELNPNLNELISLVYDKETPRLNFNSFSNINFSIQLFDLSGVLLWSSENVTINGFNNIPIQTNVSMGLYVLRVTLGSQLQNFKVWLN